MTSQFLFIIVVLTVLTGIAPIFSSVPRKYYFINSGKTWTAARAYCQANYDDLAIIDSADNLLRAKSDTHGMTNNYNIFIGMYLTPNSFLWSYKNETLGTFSIWISGYPSNSGGQRFCVMITLSGWYNAPCTLLRAFICYDGSRSGADGYIYYSTVKTWSDAQSFCRQTHTDLASARDAAEYSTILGKIPGEAWFGLFREPWKWVDKTEVSLPWYPGQPDNYNGNEYYGYMYNFQLADTYTTCVLPFLCHRVITENKQLRLKVESGLDMNDPAVNAAVLEMIQQKLKDHGMDQNITVKWRKQPGGAVFHKNNLD